MALVKTEKMLEQIQGFGSLSLWRQLGLMVLLAAIIAIAVAVVLWSRTPNYSILFGNLPASELVEIANALDAANIPYKVEHASGSITVPRSRIHETRIRLATQGLPKGKAAGYELLDRKMEFGTSRFLENARYQQALEGELARTISALDDVQQARVHLALPKDSVFVRDRVRPEASVLLQLASGQELERAQVAGIVHLVASSIPKMKPEDVAVVDQQGHLLSEKKEENSLALNTSQLDYTHQLEAIYVQRIKDILSPFVGSGGVRAQVVADLDFTVSEQTQEQYVPEKNLVRSEDIREEKNDLANPVGIPGALTNQPPRGGTTGELPENNGDKTVDVRSKHVVRNYELDRTIIHSRRLPGQVRRLSVGVVVDYKKKILDDGTIEQVALTEQELQHVTALVKEAVGFDETRKDSVNVINTSFQGVQKMEPPEEVPLWQQTWVWDLAKPALGGLFVLILVFGVLRPALNNLSEAGRIAHSGTEGEVLLASDGGAAVAGLPTPDGAVPAGQGTQDNDDVAVAEGSHEPGEEFGQKPPALDIETARSMVQKDPRRVAQVVKNWVADNE
ncbi:flagellar basal-body MS-ring/collar protein FliF [Thiolapillus brandeum]|uniref:Flagellar M-ring protein n=1 Tax=Thiolapillus brandeum TaxID=1076588 RepID=A0A7U6GIJ9_9GAMM|nr:flagellar basal-body MS-ring/collar protein FliF [Thiolapillus brandeum]BAO44306.1 flagellar M-ring protein FliF [Thiolapillus brandeum]